MRVNTSAREIVGYRVWSVSAAGRLSSAAGEWTPGVNTARCERPEGHGASLDECNCGLYALHEPVDPGPGQMLGAVSAWGEVAVARDGLRAEHARIVALAAPEQEPWRRAEASRIAARYGVRLVAADRLEAVASEHGSALPAWLRSRPWRERACTALAGALDTPPALRGLLLAIGAYGSLVTLGWWAWLASAYAVQANSRPGVGAFVLAAIPYLLALAITSARSAGGAGLAPSFGASALITVVLGVGIATPWLAGLGMPARAGDTVGLCAGAVAVLTLAGHMTRMVFAGWPGAIVGMLGGIVAGLLGHGAVALGWTSVPVLCAAALAADVGCCKRGRSLTASVRRRYA